MRHLVPKFKVVSGYAQMTSITRLWVIGIQAYWIMNQRLNKNSDRSLNVLL
jgi:hypothetical protein